MVLLLLEAFDRKCPRGRLVLVFLGKFMDIGTVPVPLLPVGGGCRTDRSISGPFCGGVLAVLLSTQGAKSGLLLVITRAGRRKVVCRELPKSKVERRAMAEVISERGSGGEMVYPGRASQELTRLPRSHLVVQSPSRHQTVRPIAGAIEVPPASRSKFQLGPWRHLGTLPRRWPYPWRVVPWLSQQLQERQHEMG